MQLRTINHLFSPTYSNVCHDSSRRKGGEGNKARQSILPHRASPRHILCKTQERPRKSDHQCTRRGSDSDLCRGRRVGRGQNGRGFSCDRQGEDLGPPAARKTGRALYPTRGVMAQRGVTKSQAPCSGTYRYSAGQTLGSGTRRNADQPC